MGHLKGLREEVSVCVCLNEGKGEGVVQTLNEGTFKVTLTHSFSLIAISKPCNSSLFYLTSPPLNLSFIFSTFLAS